MSGCLPTNWPEYHDVKNLLCSVNNGIWSGLNPPICSCNVEAQEKLTGYSRLDFPLNPPSQITLSETFDHEWTKKQIEDLHALVTDLRCENKELKQRIHKIESVIYSSHDISAIHGQLDNIHNNSEHTDFEIEAIRKRIHTLENEAEHHCSGLTVLERLNIKDRLEKLESLKLSQELDPKVWKFYHERLEKVEEKIEELELTIELNRCNLNSLIEININNLWEDVNKLKEHHTRQIDENRKISRRVDEIHNPYPEYYVVVCHHCQGTGKLPHVKKETEESI